MFALLKSRHPAWTNDELIQQVLGTADSVDEFNEDSVGLMGEGRVNAFRVLTDQPTMSEPELRLEVLDMEIVDDTGDGFSIRIADDAPTGLIDLSLDAAASDASVSPRSGYDATPNSRSLLPRA